MLQVEIDLLKELASTHGLEVMAYCAADQLEGHQSRLVAWQSNGYAGEMTFMQRDSALMTNPVKLMEEARSILVFSLSYERGPRMPFKSGFGKVARYAWGRDYHRVIKKKLKLFIQDLEKTVGSSFAWRMFSDAVPLLERAVAKKAGLGFYGKNTMLIRPGSGSFFFIAEILIAIDVVGSRLKIVEDNCGSCRRCIDNCPTSAIVDEYAIDARRCISYLTIEKGGMLLPVEREALGEWVFGCDICQEVCPFNHSELKKESAPSLSEFSAAAGCGGLLDLSKLLKIRSDQEFLRLYAGTPLMRPGRQGMLRNAACVAANTSATELCADLEAAFLEDSDAVVRASALAALSVLRRKTAAISGKRWLALKDKAVNDIDQIVTVEASACF